MSITWHGGVTVTLEVGFASLPSVAIGSTSWTDISAYLRDIPNITRGRNSETNGFETGTMTVALDNRDRRFDPNYTAGPYYGNLLPMRRVRLRFVYNAVTYAVWHGFVRGWPQDYHTSNKDAWVMLPCDDGFAVLNRQRLPDSVYAVQIPLDTPAAWWRLGETFGASAYDSSNNGHTGTYRGLCASSSGLIFGSGDGAVAFNGTTDSVLISGSPVPDFPATLECWVSYSATTAGVLITVPTVDRVLGLGVNITGADGKIRAYLNSNGSLATERFSMSTAAFNDGLTHHVAATFASSAVAPTLYVDGAAVAVTTGSSAATQGPFADSYIGMNLDGTTTFAAATIDEVACYTSVLSAGTILDHYSFGTAPWDGDVTSIRLGSLLDLASWPAADRTISTGLSTMQSAQLVEQPTLSVIQECEAAEFGQLFMGRDGTVVFRDQRWRFENTLALTSNGTFGDDGTGVELPYGSITSDDGQQLIYNLIRFNRDGGPVIERSDATSLATYYERTLVQSGLQNDSDDVIAGFADWYLAIRKDPIQRVAMLTVHPFRDPTNLIPVVLTLDIGYRVTVKRRPQNVGTALSYALLVEGINHQLGRDGTWAATFYLSAADSLTDVQPLIFDDATYGLFDTNVFGPP